MKMFGDIPVCGEPVLENALKQMQTCRTKCERAVMNADHHVGYGCPIGGVMASQELISPTAVGYDIACGNKAVRLDVPADSVLRDIKKLMDEIASQVSFGIGRVSGWDVQSDLLDDPAWTEIDALRSVKKTSQGQPLPLIEFARNQLGTVGSGNHFVDVFIDEEDRVWVGVHFGSRGLGHHIATYFLEAANADEKDPNAAPVNLHMYSDLGREYIKSMEIAGQYAYAGRDAVCKKVAEMLGGKIVEEVHNHHNFAWRETHGDIEYWVCRKGATPAFPGQLSFIGGSMGDDSVIVTGVDSEDSKTLLYSTVHGAGRVMSRTQATGKSRYGKVKGEGLISKDSMFEWIQGKGVELRGADVDEAPQAYKRLSEVLPQQGNTIQVLHTLRPIGVAMAGSDVIDPYKD